VVVIGGGVVGAAVALLLTRHGAEVVLLEAAGELACGASGTNSGILHSGFDSTPGTLEASLIVGAAQTRDAVLEPLAVPVLRCGARVVPDGSPDQAEAVRELARNAQRNNVEVRLHDDGVLHVPGEHVTDPVAVVRAFAGAAQVLGARVHVGAHVDAIAGDRVHIASGGSFRADAIINCAGLRGDEIARLAGDDSFGVYPRKGEFLVFAGAVPDIRLPVPRPGTKGVLVFPTTDGHTIVGPTAVDGEDKDDWSVRPAGRDALLEHAAAHDLHDPVAVYAGLRPAGRDGANYVVGPSQANPRLINVAAIRSTGLSAALGLAQQVRGMLDWQGVALADHPGPLPPLQPPATDRPWWQRAADRSAACA
jgi:glycerol-3-phosphate dehydrogenase